MTWKRQQEPSTLVPLCCFLKYRSEHKMFYFKLINSCWCFYKTKNSNCKFLFKESQLLDIVTDLVRFSFACLFFGGFYFYFLAHKWKRFHLKIPRKCQKSCLVSSFSESLSKTHLLSKDNKVLWLLNDKKAEDHN